MAIVALMTNPILVSCLYLPFKLSSPVHNFLCGVDDDEVMGMELTGEDGPRRDDDDVILLDGEDSVLGAFNTQSNRCSQNSLNQGFLALVAASGFNAK